jgi:hypothetical protein
MIGVLLAVLFAVQMPGRDSATFVRRVAELDAASAHRSAASSADARAASTLDWLRALQNVLKAIPIERADGPHHAWLEANQEPLVYDEPGGQWLIRHDVVMSLHAEHAGSAAADEIAWLAVTNGLPGECEGYVPCYASKLDQLEGGYLRAHPTGRHRREAFEKLVELMAPIERLRNEDELKAFLAEAGACDDLVRSIRPLRSAILGAGGAGTKPLAVIDHALSVCQ